MTGRSAKFLTTALCAHAVLLASCAADRLHREGMKAVESGDYEQGVQRLADAVKADPNNLAYRLDLRVRTDSVTQALIAAADSARAAGRRDEAAQEYHRVLALDPSNDRALRGLEGVAADARHSDVITAAQKEFLAKDYDRAETAVRSVLSEDPGFAPALALHQKIDEARGPVQAVPKLKTRDNRPVTLQFRDASTKMVFEVLSRQTGVNFIFDKDVKADGKTTIFVTDVPIETAIDLVLGQNQLGRQVLAQNMVMIYPNTTAKLKDYQDEVVKTFYLSNADPKQAQTLIKTIVNPKAMFIDERTGVLVIRDTPEVVRMAEKLIDSVDLPDSEVMLEVEVLEISKNLELNLGIGYPSSAAFGMTAVGAAAAGASGGTGATSGFTVADYARQGKNTITATPLSVTLNMLKTDSDTNLLASPRIRVRNHEKAKIVIGERVPTITNTVPLSTATVTPYASSSIQYLEVGLTLEVEPVIHRDGDVAIKLGLEVSTLGDQVQTQTATAYRVGTRNTQTLLQLKDGETQILAGLIQDSDTISANKLPGLGDLPLIGRLFGSQDHKRDKSEIVLAITPRVIRAQSRPSTETTEFWYGTETSTRSAPIGGFTVEGLGGTGATGVARSGYGSPGAPNNVLQSAMVAPLAAPPTPPPAPAAVQAAPVPAGEAASAAAAAPGAVEAAPAATQDAGAGAATGAPPTLSWDGPTAVKVGDEFDVTLALDSALGLTQLRSQVRYDPAALELVSASPGGILGAAAPNLETPRGAAMLDATASADAPVTGSGSLMLLHFRALAPRSATTVAAKLAASTARGGAGMPSAPNLNIAITKP